MASRLAPLYQEISRVLGLRRVPYVRSFQEALSITKDILNRLRDYNDEIYVMFSGGRDSLVVLHLASTIFNRVKCIYIVVNGNTHEKNSAYVKRITRELGVDLIVLMRRDIEFYERVVKWGWPGPRRKWCMTEFKRRPIESYFKGSSYPVVLIGTKRSDSGRRKIYVENDGIVYSSKWSTIAVRPIAHWNDEYVEKYLEENSLPKCELYEELGESGNCVYCPFIVSRDYYRRLYEKYPRWIKKIVCAELLVKRGKPFVFGRRKISILDLLGKSLSELARELELDCCAQ